MATESLPGILFQAVGTGSDADVYVANTGAGIVFSSIVICNPTGGPISYRIAIRESADSLETKHHIAYDAPCPANDSVFITAGVCVNSEGIVSVRGNGLIFQGHGLVRS